MMKIISEYDTCYNIYVICKDYFYFAKNTYLIIWLMLLKITLVQVNFSHYGLVSPTQSIQISTDR
jgi:hypothetical protein